jgi:O-acetyl-ADP-ribose deacetylase (regulator of RNase III)
VQLEVDAIVNPTDCKFSEGGGLDCWIHRFAGETLKKECEAVGGIKVGDAVLTGGYCLPARYVIHTVGPQDCCEDDLRRCYTNILNLARKNGIRTLALPCISTGRYRYPSAEAAMVALDVVRGELQREQNCSAYPDDRAFDRIIFCTYMWEDSYAYERFLPAYFPRVV